MAKDLPMRKIVLFTLMIVVLVFGIIFSLQGGIPQTWKDLLPGFKTADIVARWQGEYYIDKPEWTYFYIIGDNANIYLHYNPFKKNWSFYLAGTEKWIKVGDIPSSREAFEIEHHSFWKSRYGIRYFEWLFGNEEQVVKDNLEFIRGLKGKTPEKGFEHIINRVLADDEGNELPWSNVQFQFGFAKYGDPKIELKSKLYDVGEEDDINQLRDVDGIISKINQMIRAWARTKGYKI